MKCRQREDENFGGMVKIIPLFKKSKNVETMEINIQQRLKYLRLKHQFTQKQISSGIEIREKAYQAYEEGRAVPSVFTLFRIADFYGYTSLDIMLGVKDGESKLSEFNKAYHSAPIDKRKIVDFVLNLDC